jgi:hypothetical protein
MSLALPKSTPSAESLHLLLEDLMPKTLESLRSIDVRKIDLDEARRHFDLPIDEQFASKRELTSGLATTKAQLISLFKESDSIEVWRGMNCDRDWAMSVEQGSDVGESWAWQMDGALKGSGLEQNGANGVVIHGAVDEADIDWETTIAVATFHEAEYEIVISDPSAVTLTSIVEWPSGETIRVFDDEVPTLAM